MKVIPFKYFLIGAITTQVILLAYPFVELGITWPLQKALRLTGQLSLISFTLVTLKGAGIGNVFKEKQGWLKFASLTLFTSF
jgi:hypothetical protein